MSEKNKKDESVLAFWGRTCRAAIAAQPQIKHGVPHFTVPGVYNVYCFDRGDVSGPGLVVIGASSVTITRGAAPRA